MSISNQEPPRGIVVHSLRDLYSIVFRHLVVGWTCFGLVLALTFSLVRLSSPSYRSEAKLLVRLDHEAAPLPSSSSASLRAQMHSEMEILRSPDLLNNVSEALTFADPSVAGMDPDDLDPCDAITTKQLADELSVSLEEDSNVLTVRFRHRDPKIAQAVLAKLVELYLLKHIEVHQDYGAYEFFLQQSQDLAVRIEATESELNALKSELGVSSLEADRRVALESVTQLERQRQQAMVALAASKAKVERLETELESIPESQIKSESTGRPSAPAERLRERLNELLLLEKELLGNYLENSRLVQDVRTRIELAEGLLEGEGEVPSQVTLGPSANHQRVALDLVLENADFAAQAAQIAVLDEEYAESLGRFASLNAHAPRYEELERELGYLRGSYERFQVKLEQSRVERALEKERISNIGVLQNATLPVEPSGPAKTDLFLFGAFLAAAMGLMSTFVAEYFDDTIRTPEELKALIGDRPQVSLPRLRRWPLVDPPPLANEAFRNLREQWMLGGRGEDPGARFVAVTGARRRAGATTVAAGLARSLARFAEQPVALVDANFVDGNLSARLAPGVRGLSDALVGEGMGPPPMRSVGVEHLHLVPVGKSAHPLLERLDPERVMAVLRTLANSCAWVVIDLPPISTPNAFAALAAACDHRVLVVEAARTRRQVVQRTLDALRIAQKERGGLGVVLNKRSFPVPAWLYGGP